MAVRQRRASSSKLFSDGKRTCCLCRLIFPRRRWRAVHASCLQSYPRLRIEAYAADYFAGLAELGKKPRRRTLALFLGSNISNFDLDEALRFLRAIRSVLQKGDALLLGADLKKDPAILEAAYNDALGVTSAFNLNVLARINRELGGTFDLRAFRHRAFYNEAIGRIEIYIESLINQTRAHRKTRSRRSSLQQAS